MGYIVCVFFLTQSRYFTFVYNYCLMRVKYLLFILLVKFRNTAKSGIYVFILIQGIHNVPHVIISRIHEVNCHS